MTTGKHRLPSGGAIDRARPLDFSFDGTAYRGLEGDTLASALLANGVHLVGRSFKYHRPRGILSIGSEEPNALVELGTDARREPNTRATTIELYDGLTVASQNRWPSLKFDALAANALLSPLFVAGFYYKTFKWPAAFWEPVYERLIRRAAGLGRASGQEDPDRYETCHAHCDVLVVGAGPAGLTAARRAAEAGERVILCDEAPWLGGRLAFERGEVESLPAADWIRAQAAALAGLADLQVLRRTAVFGAYDHNVFGALERVAERQALPGQPRQRFWTIRARRAIIATGAQERPLIFPGNDLPGVMLASAVRGYANRFAVAAGRRVAVATNNDDAYRTALDLKGHGIEVVLVADSRSKPGDVAEQAEAAGIEVRRGVLPGRAMGRRHIRRLELVDHDGRTAGTCECDCLAVSGGFTPVVHLASHRGARPAWSESAAAFLARDTGRELTLAGAARGAFALRDCLVEGRAVGYGEETAPEPLWEVSGRGKAFVDFQNDVTAEDLRLAVREGYRAPEHAKRYTTLGMATDQGKTANVNALGILAAAQGKAMIEMGPVTYRPPYLPVAIGALAGHRRGRDFRPIRRTAMQAWHERAGAVFVEVGDWLRPSYYPRAGESTDDSINRETLAVRRAAGLCDVSTLGKIEIFGPDAAELLNRLYVNGWSRLPVGRARYGLMLREDGFVFDDGTTSRLAEDRYFMTTTTVNAAAVLAHMEFHHQCVWPELSLAFCSATEQWAGMALAGPNARRILERVVEGLDLSDASLPFMGVAEGRIGDVPARVFRISFSGELAYEINVAWGFGEAVWQRILEAGRDLGLEPYGLEALNVLRIEKGHVTGSEIDGRTTAADLGFARMTSESKEFVGRALARRPGLTDPDRPALVGIRPANGSSRLRAGAQITPADDTGGGGAGWSFGHVTSVAFSPSLGHWIGLALVSGGRRRIGERLLARFPLKDETVPIEIVEPCFIDTEGKRLHG
jgi:methylglutamate dehydrogenase subunit C